MENQSIAKKLVYQRKLKGYTQEKLSDEAQVTVRTIQRIEKSEVQLHLQTIKLLAAALSIEVDDLSILENPKEENVQKKWLLLLHGTPVLGLALPLCNILFPLFLWIHKREDNAIYDNHGIKVINFQISMTILYILSFVALLTLEGWGFLLFIAVIPVSLVISFYNIIMVINAHKCYYPLSIPFLKQNKGKVSKKMMSIFAVGAFLFTSCMHVQAQSIMRLDGSILKISSLATALRSYIFRDLQCASSAAAVSRNKNLPSNVVNIFGIFYRF